MGSFEVRMNKIMDSDGINRAITRLCVEIIEKNKGLDNLYLIGIQRRGVALAERIADKMMEMEKVRPKVGVLDITFYRDDLSVLNEHPLINDTSINFPFDGAKLVIVDDVLFTGRTVRAAIEAIMEMGRPSQIQLAILVDRGHREIPIRADYVGKNVPTSAREIVEVHVQEIDGQDGVVIKEYSSDT